MKNNGTAKLIISSISINAGSYFAISPSTCGVTLALGKTCNVTVTFSPTELGYTTGTLTFTNDAPNSSQTVALSGTGVQQVTLTPSSLTYSKPKVGTTSVVKNVTLTNNQTVLLDNISFSVTGDVGISATACGTSLVPKGKCTISLTFTPTRTGTRTGQLTVSDSQQQSPNAESNRNRGLVALSSINLRVWLRVTG